MEKELLARSDPENAEMYGKWFSKVDIDDMLRNTISTNAVKNFVEKHFHNDAYELTTGGDFLQVFTTVEKVELMVRSCRY